jgi:vesicle-fusing ATPase
VSARGDDSDLHIIIFDEIDSVCKQRGSTNSGTGVHDTVVNQLLSKIDGVESLNNILVIGMTNRKDMIDEALMRPGRFEVHVEISLPDEAGRLQILKIHTTPMREAKVLGNDVQLPHLAAETKNFSGAEIEGLVKSAASFAFQRHVTAESGGMKTGKLDDMQLVQADFERALTEVKPAFGVSSDDLAICVRGGLIEYSAAQQEMVQAAGGLLTQLQTSEHTSLLTMLIEGEPGAGKTAAAATLALSSGFHFVKLISPNSLIGVSEAAKANHIARVFDDAHKSPLSLVLIDDLERLLEYVRIGPRFSNLVLQTLLTCLKKQPKTGKLVILGTSSNVSVLESLEMLEAFNVTFNVPTLAKSEALTVLRHLGAKRIESVDSCLNAVSKGIPIKKLLLVAEMSMDAERSLDPARFTTTMQSAGLLEPIGF